MHLYRPYTSDILQFNATTVKHDLNTLFTDMYVLDTETTGLDKHSEITQLSIIDLISGHIMIDTLVQPTNLIGYSTSKAFEITGIAEESLLHAPTFDDVYPSIKTLLSTKRIAIYNSRFDSSMILRSCLASSVAPIPFSTLCVMKLFSSYIGSLDNWSLTEACQMMSIDVEQFGDIHNANADAQLTRLLLLAMKER